MRHLRGHRVVSSTCQAEKRLGWLGAKSFLNTAFIPRAKITPSTVKYFTGSGSWVNLYCSLRVLHRKCGGLGIHFVPYREGENPCHKQDDEEPTDGEPALQRDLADGSAQALRDGKVDPMTEHDEEGTHHN